MGNISENLDRSEFLCGCGCGLADPHPMLVAGLQELCDRARDAAHERPKIVITSGCRCHRHNENIGGAARSHHQPQENGYCGAADCYLDGWTLRDTLAQAVQVYRFASGAIGLYRDGDAAWLHLDVRRVGHPVRWARLDGQVVDLEEVLYRDEQRRKEPA